MTLHVASSLLPWGEAQQFLLLCCIAVHLSFCCVLSNSGLLYRDNLSVSLLVYNTKLFSPLLCPLLFWKISGVFKSLNTAAECSAEIFWVFLHSWSLPLRNSFFVIYTYSPLASCPCNLSVCLTVCVMSVLIEKKMMSYYIEILADFHFHSLLSVSLSTVCVPVSNTMLNIFSQTL